MNLEIHKPELVRRVNAQIQSGQFHDADELIERALDALERKSPPSAAERRRAAGRKSLLEVFDTNVPSELTRPQPDPRVAHWLEDTDDELMHISNPSPKLAITVDPDVHEKILATAARDRVSVSAWMANAAREALKRRAGLAAVELWEKQHGRFTSEEAEHKARLEPGVVPLVPAPVLVQLL